VFGGIDRDNHEGFAVPVEKRDAATLLPIIHQFILPGTTILSDQLAAYNNISAGLENYARQTVNHSLHFIDSETHAHTQNIENMWMCIKRKKKQQMGQHNSLLPTRRSSCGGGSLEIGHWKILSDVFMIFILFCSSCLLFK